MSVIPDVLAGTDCQLGDPEVYRVPSQSWRRLYRFPFTPLDTTGPQSRGRIMWHLELLRSPELVDGQRPIADVLLWARQTRDPRYSGILFHLPTHAERLEGRARWRDEPTALLEQVRSVGWCTEHDGIILMAYPENHHTSLVLDLSLSVSMRAYFLSAGATL